MPAILNSTAKCSAADEALPPQGRLLVFADDWGRHPSSCQHLIRHLLDRYQVSWVNTIGTRPPRLDLATLKRGLEKSRAWLRRPAPSATSLENPRVLNPRMWPWFSTAFGRWLNRRLLLRQLSDLCRESPLPTVAVTTIPLVSELIGLLPVQHWVYYCVDDFGQWPGLDQATLRRMEGRLIERADRVIAVSETLQDKLARSGRTAPLLTHGVDLDFWEQPQEGVSIPELRDVERPLIAFWGVLDQRMDVSFIRRLAGDLEKGTVVLVGPTTDPDPALDRMGRVLRLPPLAFAQLPVLGREAAVLVMPYADLPVTRAIQPLKLKEYLATGKPTVVRNLPATHGWSDCLDLVDTAETFSAAVRLRLQTGLPSHQRAARTNRLVGESWAEKARTFEHLALSSGSAAG